MQIRGLKYTHKSIRLMGGEGSGFHGHSGRPGSVGGSLPSSGSANYAALSSGISSGTLKRSDDSDDYEKGHFESYRIDIEGDGRAIIKPEESGRRLSHSEVAAYQLSEELGLKVVPATIATTTEDGRYASAQAWEEGMSSGWEADAEFPNHAFDPKSARKVIILDVITGNGDRREPNWLVDPKTGRVSAIDNGLAFRERYFTSTHLMNTYKLRTGKNKIQLTDTEITKFTKVLKNDSFWDNLDVPGTNKDFARLQLGQLIEIGSFSIPLEK